MRMTKIFVRVRVRQRLVTTRAVSTTSEQKHDEKWGSFVAVDNFLRLSQTLPSGQAFRWRRTGDHAHALSTTGFAEEWVGPIRHHLYVLRQTVPRPPPNKADPVWFRVVAPDGAMTDKRAEAELRDYFRADTDFSTVYEGFCAADETFARIFPHLNGLRLLRTPPEECVFSYICSSNNHIKRISSMVISLASTYGEPLGSYGGESYAIFPTTEILAERADEKELRKAGFGYRAKFIAASAIGLVQHAQNSGANCVHDMLISWRKEGRIEVARRLTRYPGIGRKVAGCIALVSMDKLGEIPVDTHVWQVAQRYMPYLTTKTLTSRVYEDVGNWFRKRFGDDVAGIAHLFLFAGELSEFKKIIPHTLNPRKPAVQEAQLGNDENVPPDEPGIPDYRKMDSSKKTPGVKKPNNKPRRKPRTNRSVR